MSHHFKDLTVVQKYINMMYFTLYKNGVQFTKENI